MSIFNFTDEQSLGEVRSVETSRITVRVTDGQRLQKARVGRLVAIQLMGDEWLIGIIERVWRHPVELPTLPEADPSADLAAVPQEENGVSISLVGTYRARDGQRKDTFTRAVFILPEINRPVFPIEEKSLEDFMGILSASSKADAAAPLKVGTYTLDGKASAYIDGDKLFQRHAALLGSTGSGKSFTVASILEQSAQLPHANIVVFDLHGEYSSMKFASHYRIAGIGDLKAKKDGAIFLPFWLLNYDEMQSLFVDRSEESAPNQASELMKQVVELKKKSIEGLGKHDLLDGFTVDTPVPYRLADLIEAIAEKDKEMVQGSKGEKQGPLFGKLTRFLNRISVKTKDRRYAFMYQAPAEYETYEALHQLASTPASRLSIFRRCPRTSYRSSLVWLRESSTKSSSGAHQGRMVMPAILSCSSVMRHISTCQAVLPPLAQWKSAPWKTSSASPKRDASTVLG